MFTPTPRPVLLEWKGKLLRFCLIFSLLPTITVHSTPKSWSYAKNIQTRYHELLNSSLSSLVVTPSPDLQALLPNCSLHKKIKAHISFVCSSSPRVFTCSNQNSFAPQLWKVLTGSKGDFKPPPYFSFICKIFYWTFMVIFFKTLRRYFETLWNSNMFKIHDGSSWAQQTTLEQAMLGCLVCSPLPSDKQG